MVLRSVALAASIGAASIGIASIGIVGTALAEDLKPEEAKRFVAGKMFSYTCFEGTNGAGRIFADGSVAGTVQIGGKGPVHHVVLPTGTVKVSTGSICATVRGVPFQPCFNVVKTDPASFRGSLTGFSFAYCNFTRHNPRSQLLRSAGQAGPMTTAGAIPVAATRSARAVKPVQSVVVLRGAQN